MVKMVDVFFLVTAKNLSTFFWCAVLRECYFFRSHQNLRENIFPQLPSTKLKLSSGISEF